MKGNKGGLAQLVAVSENLVHLTAAATLRLDQRLVRCDSTGGAFAVTLPNVGEAAGMIFSVYLDVDNGNVTVQDQNESVGWTDAVMTAVGDHIVVYSDGLTWFVLASTLTV